MLAPPTLDFATTDTVPDLVVPAAPPAPPVPQPEVRRPWSLPTRLAFQFCVVYFGIYVLCTQMLQSLVVLPAGSVPDLGATAATRAVMATIDVNARTLGLTRPASSGWTAQLAFERPAPELLILDGAMDGHKIRMKLRLHDRNKFLLVTRGFHWIQEVPFNR